MTQTATAVAPFQTKGRTQHNRPHEFLIEVTEVFHVGPITLAVTGTVRGENATEYARLYRRQVRLDANREVTNARLVVSKAHLRTQRDACRDMLAVPALAEYHAEMARTVEAIEAALALPLS